jgi:iron complex outermembrane receptor protein
MSRACRAVYEGDHQMHSRLTTRYLLRCAVATALATPFAVPAQTNPADVPLEEIIVTARKRDEALLDVPVAVNAFSEKEIESAGILRPQDFIALTPNMTMVQTQNQGTSFIVVRGISQARNSEPSVAVLIDGVAMANPSQFNQELFDIESIQVLKGPQGALYGRNAIGGAVIIQTRQPGDELSGKITLGYDSGPGYTVRAGVGGPVGSSDTWKFMVSGSYLDTDGYIDNPYLHEEADPFKDVSGRARLIWQPNDGFKADLRVYGSAVDTQALYFNITESVNDTHLPVRVNNAASTERDLYGVSLKLDWETSIGTLTSVTAYDSVEELLTGDQFDFLPPDESVLKILRPGPGATPVARRRRREPGVAVDVRLGGTPALDRRRLRHFDRPLHLHGQCVRFRNRRSARGQGTPAAALQPAVHVPRGLAGQLRVGRVRRGGFRPHSDHRSLGRAALRP